MSTRLPPPAFEKKICSLEELSARRAELEGPVVFTNGVFDLLHRGHVLSCTGTLFRKKPDCGNQ